MNARAELHQALRRLDARLEAEVVRLRARYQLSLDEFRGLYVSDEQVDALLDRRAEADRGAGPLPPLEPGPSLGAIARAFALSGRATEILLLAAAPELSPRYATLIAYLNDDVQRRAPSIDLAWRLFGEVGDALDADGPLFGPGLLQLADAAPRPPRALQAFTLHPLAAARLLGEAPSATPGLARLSRPPPGATTPLAPLRDRIAGAAPPRVAVLAGRPTSGRAEAVAALAAELDRPAFRLDLPAEPAALAALLRDAALAARLYQGVLVVEPQAVGLAALRDWLLQPPAPVFLLLDEGAAWREPLTGCAVREIVFRPPDAAARRALWAGALGDAGLDAPEAELAATADRYRLDAGQIAAAAGVLAWQAGAAVDFAAMADAARGQSRAAMGGLAARVESRRDWSELILPPGTLRQLQHLGDAVRNRRAVFERWGFDRVGASGLVALFSGGSGTGKSMSAGILARDAGLDIWRIDLSAVVSKYIGETEKQLERIFNGARDGDVILFFDEADALFGKRSEVKDAHDRYANIETAYLLQRLESYDGVAILATNLARNLDRAFSRRIHFAIDFPMPDPGLRERLWRQALPAGAPLGDDLDLGFLAERFAFSGGDIRVIALDAAFAAAASDQPIDMAAVVPAVARQLQKQGALAQAADFRPYHALLADPRPPPALAAQ